jgi:uncharacterized membrane protein YgdD (TMEM256/DUF423 family)
MARIFSLFGSSFGLLGVVFGAFGAHALEKLLEESNRTATFDTAVQYQFVHAISLLIIGFLAKSNPTKALKTSGYSAIIGIILFSGSLYTICLTGITIFGAIAPIGGALMVTSWAFLAFHFYKYH